MLSCALSVAGRTVWQASGPEMVMISSQDLCPAHAEGRRIRSVVSAFAGSLRTFRWLACEKAVGVPLMGLTTDTSALLLTKTVYIQEDVTDKKTFLASLTRQCYNDRTTMKNTFVRKAIGISLLVFLMALPLYSLTINVGFFPDGQYMYKTPDGHYRGYDIEYLNEVAKYNGWDYHFVDFATWDENIQGLADGVVDLLPAIIYTPERAEKFLLSERDMGSIYVTLIVKSTNDVSFGDYAAFTGKTVGILQDSADGASFRQWAKDRRMEVNIVEYPSTNDLLDVLDKGIVDAVAITNLGSVPGVRVVAEFCPLKMYFAFNKNCGELKKELDETMASLSIINPKFEFNLVQRYLSISLGSTPMLTEPEKAYVAGNPLVNVAVLEDDMPFSSVDEAGNIRGMIPDLFRHFSGISGLQFKFIPVRTREIALNLLRTGDIDVIAPILDDSSIAIDQGINLTNPFLHMSVVRISEKGNEADVPRIAIPEGDIASLFSLDADSGAAIVYPSLTKCFEALRQKNADIVCCPITTGNYWLSTHHAQSYNMSSLASYSYDVAIGVRTNTPAQLFSLLNTCVRYTNVAAIDEMLAQNSLVRDDTLAAMIDKLSTKTIAIIVFILACLIILLVAAIMVLVKRRQNERKIAQEKEEARKREEMLESTRKANVAKSSFLSSISHDMRTPLNGIIGFINLALETNDVDRMRDYLGKIQISSTILLDLINDTLELSKIENGKMPINKEAVRIHDVIDHVAIPTKAACDAKGVTFVLDKTTIPDEIIMTDRVNLQKILLNLLGNAVKFTPKGGTVSFSFSRLDPPVEGRNARFMVTDTGEGMSEEFIQEKLYQPFCQEHRDEGDSHVGSGLGLSIVQQLVNLMEGRIEVESELGKGTSFTVFLHFDLASEEQKLQKKEDIAVSAEKLACLKGRHVLLCEDNNLNTEIAKNILERQGMVVSCAENGKIAVDLFSACPPHSFDVILMDIRMPVMNGYQATDAIRTMTREDGKNIPILAMTAESIDDVMIGKLKGEISGYICKPINPPDMFASIIEVLGL